MRRRALIGVPLLALATTMAGCGRAAPTATPTAAATARPSPTTVARPTVGPSAGAAAAATPTGQKVVMAAVTVPPQAQQQVALVVEDLRQRLRLSDASSIIVASVQEIEWGDTSLGCPKEGMVYAQMIAPGYTILLQATGTTYEYHTDFAERFVLCEGGRPVEGV